MYNQTPGKSLHSCLRSCVLTGQLESAINKIKLIGRLQDEVTGLTAAVEIEQRSALHELQLSVAKTREHRIQNTADPEFGVAAAPRTTDASVQVSIQNGFETEQQAAVGVQSWAH